MSKKPAFLYDLVPVSIDLYSNDAVVNYRPTGGNLEPKGGKREAISKLSEKSLRRLAFTAANSPLLFRSMLTLTYPKVYPGTGKEVKKHLNRFLTSYRRRYPRANSYLWFMEFQGRGAPHIHLLLTTAPDAKDLTWVSQQWFDCADSGDLKHLGAGTNWRRLRKPDGAKRYAVKYASKTRQKAVPKQFGNVGRFWACSKDCKPEPTERIELDHPAQIDSLVEGWPYATKVFGCKVLYNAADIIHKNLTKAEQSFKL